MGQDLSRIVDTLYHTPKPKQLAALDTLLQEPKLYKNLVKGAKSENLRFPLQHKSAKSKLTALQNLEPSCVVDSTIVDVWSRDISVFWNSPELELRPWNGELACVYDNTVQLQTRHGLDDVRGRFLKLFYRDSLHLINPRAAYNKTTNEVYENLTNLIASKSSVTQDAAMIRSNLVGWVKAGRRYHRLTATFGTAILFILPDSLLIDFLEKRFPFNDKAYEKAVQPLASLGACAKQLDSNQVAERLRKMLLKPYEFLRVEMSPPHRDECRKPPPSPTTHFEPGIEIPKSNSGLDHPHRHQGMAQCSERVLDLGTRDRGTENESHGTEFHDRTSETSSSDICKGNYSLDYYNDPSLFDEDLTLEYYLNVAAPLPAA